MTKERTSAASMAEMVDFYPTLASMAGLESPKHLAGVNLQPALAKPQRVVRQSAFTQYDVGYSIRTPRYRYTEWGLDGSLGAELYDHQTDSHEMINLATQASQADVVERLSEQLRERVVAAMKKPAGVNQRRLAPKK